MKHSVKAFVVGLVGLVAGTTQGATFFYTGPNGGEFFNESNWNSISTGGGTSPLAGEIDPDIGILHDLIIEGKSVMATGPAGANGFRLDIGAGGILSLLAGSDLQVTNTSFNAQFEISTGGTFVFADANLGVDDDILLRGTSMFSGGTVESFADDIEFISSAITINGTEFTSDDSTIFRAEITPSAGSSVTGATFNAASRIGVREFNVTVTDSHFNVTGDVEDVFATDLPTATAALTLLGNSTLIADQVQEGVRLILGDSSTATLTNEADPDELTWFTETSTATLNSPNAQLILLNPQTDSSAAKIFNGVTGMSYASDSSTWIPTTWNGTDAVTLSITSLPSNADFDGDGDVDGRDFLIWQRGFGLTGQTSNSNGDANGNGTVDGVDLADWQAKYGGAPLVAAVAAVPEPASLLLIIMAVAGYSCKSFRRA
ncbi:dockerin type I domain-containing protein [Bythopirellula polymerisocia]|uniref:PEP-CTERM protein-sorting domain-containing protein n=1 Tax=Bythopirellula polymerisocia TaxID=2528003 RepID=A0A5C6CHL2_9BACT|nr:dockerin type I domain-containing protein [Bythopirellula polymerisocia]TWU23515.1 hypothetical protein Pla144_36900 [Bythopirellula polymerisocia]